MESILTTIKKLLGIMPDSTEFDRDIIVHINSVFLILSQIGIGPSTPFSITGDEKWNDFIPDGNYDILQSYMYLRVRLLFDPPVSSAVMDSMNRMISEYEWRLNVYSENKQL